jgi:hypothetical protein
VALASDLEFMSVTLASSDCLYLAVYYYVVLMSTVLMSTFNWLKDSDWVSLWGVFKPCLVLRRRTSRASTTSARGPSCSGHVSSKQAVSTAFREEGQLAGEEILRGTQGQRFEFGGPTWRVVGTHDAKRASSSFERTSFCVFWSCARQHDVLRRRTCLRGRSDCHGSAGQNMDHGPGSPVAGEQSVHSPCTESDAWAVDGNTDKNV